MKLTCIRKVLLSVLAVILTSLVSYGQQTLWVGESYTFDVGSSVVGLTANMSWSTSGGYLSLSGSGFYRDIKVTQYFSGTATVTCEWDYKLTGNGSYTHTKRQVTISCHDNKVSISPTSLTMSPGETQYVSYRHQYDNQYTPEANAYFQSLNPKVAEVDQKTGQVTALSPGETYINVYSKISSDSPICRVVVKKVEPTSVSLPSTMSLIAGESGSLTPSLTPSGAQTTYVWKSSNPEIATVNNGKVQAKHHGNTIISVTTANGLTSSCNLTVNKSRLILNKTLESGLYSRGTTVALSSVAGATIYYTIDGSKPTLNSTAYTTPVIIDSYTNLRAIATHPDYIDSEEISAQYEVTDLIANTRFPEKDGITISKFNIPHIDYNMELSGYLDTKKIRVLINNELVDFKPVIINNSLFIIPDESKYEVSPDNSTTCTISVESYAIRSVNNEPNQSETLTLTLSNYLENELEFPTQLYSSGDYGHSFITSKNNWRGLGKWERQDVDFSVSDVIKSCPRKAVYAYITENGKLFVGGDDSYIVVNKNNNQFSNLLHENVIDVACGKMGSNTLFFVTSDNTLYGQGDLRWGFNNLVNNNLVNYPVKLMENVKSVVAAEFGIGAAIKQDGTLWFWGHDCTSDQVYEPIKLDENVRQVSVCDHGTPVFVKNDNTAWYVTLSNKKPVKHKIADEVLMVAGGYTQGYYITLDNKLYGWRLQAWADSAPIGDGTGEDDYIKIITPENAVFIMDNVTNISYSSEPLVLSKDNDIYTWGVNLGWGKTATPHLLWKAQRITELENLVIPNEVTAYLESTSVIPRQTIPLDGICKSAQWSISNPEITEINDYGVLTPRKEGSCIATLTITKFDGTQITYQSNITVLPERINNIESINNNSNDEYIYFTLQGIKVLTCKRDIKPELPKGFYIVRHGANATKVFLK